MKGENECDGGTNGENKCDEAAPGEEGGDAEGERGGAQQVCARRNLPEKA